MHNHSSLGQYIMRHTFWHHIDVRIKLLLILFFIIGVFLPTGIFGLLIYILIILSILVQAKIPWRNFKTIFKFIFFFYIFITLLNGFFFLPNALTSSLNRALYGDFIYSGGLNSSIYGGVSWYSFNSKVFLKAAFVCGRIFVIFGLMIMLTSTTKPLDLTLGIEKLFKPLTYLKVPVQTLSLIISLALQSLPILATEFKKVVQAQASRGIDIKTKNPIKKVRAISALLIPMFTSALRKADDLSLALDAKGYDPVLVRSQYRHFHLHFSEIINLCIIVLLITLISYNAWNLIYGNNSDIIQFINRPNYNFFPAHNFSRTDLYFNIWRIDVIASR